MEEEEKNGRPGKKKSTKRRKRTGGKRETKEKRGGKKTKRNRRMKISRHRLPILLSIFFSLFPTIVPNSIRIGIRNVADLSRTGRDSTIGEKNEKPRGEFYVGIDKPAG